MPPRQKPDQNPDYNETPMDRRVFMRRIGAAGVAAAGVGYMAFAPESAPFSLKDSTGDRSVVPPEPFRLRDFRVKKLRGMNQDIGIARAERGESHRYSRDEKRALLLAALDAVGGIKHYVKRGDKVLLKPNVAFDRAPIMGATTDPQMVGELVRILLQDARAAEVRVADNPIESAVDCFRKTGIERAATEAGATVQYPHLRFFKELNIPGATLIENWPFFAAPFEGVDKVIGLCPVKDHNLCQASVSIKNWMGMLGGTRNQFHDDIHELISDLSLMIKPTLSIVDGTRVLAEMGPTGGDLSYVRNGNVVLAGLDPVATDAWAIEHCLERGNMYPEYLALAEAKGSGRRDWTGRTNEVLL